MQQTLLEQVSSFENLALAYHRCSRGKKHTVGYQNSVFTKGERLVEIRAKLLSGGFRWQGYREFLVHDPKTRLIMAAPYMDRVVHHAIHQVIHPHYMSLLDSSSYACREGMGSRKAVIDLCRAVSTAGTERYCIKLDVKKYFESIDHSILLALLTQHAPDSSLICLLKSLLESHPLYAARGFGIPIGNLTSQLFANVYLASADQVAKRSLPLGSYYCRYMDDLVFINKDKSSVLDASDAVIEHVQNQLKLKIPFQKRVHLGNAPIPFLGFVIDERGYRVLTRNLRRFAKHERRLFKACARPSRIAQSKQSHDAWKNLAKGRMHL